MGDDARKRILERRAAFVAAALSTVAADGCSKPRVCLDVPNEVPIEIRADDATAKPPPSAPTYDDATTTVKEEKEDAGVDAPKPMSAPCLSVAHPRDAGPPSPKPCLKVDPYFDE